MSMSPGKFASPRLSVKTVPLSSKTLSRCSSNSPKLVTSRLFASLPVLLRNMRVSPMASRSFCGNVCSPSCAVSMVAKARKLPAM